MTVVSEKLTSNAYKFLWDLLFDNHPKGDFIRGKWQAQGRQQTNVPSEALILELLQYEPVMLLLDEFQTWFDGQTEGATKPQRTWAFNFIQTLSEIAKNRMVPEVVPPDETISVEPLHTVVANAVPALPTT
jgi:hypothetical protein